MEELAEVFKLLTAMYVTFLNFLCTVTDSLAHPRGANWGGVCDINASTIISTFTHSFS